MSKAHPYKIMRYLNGILIDESQEMRHEECLAQFKRAKYFDIHKPDPEPRKTYWWNDRHGLNKVRMVRADK